MNGLVRRSSIIDVNDVSGLILTVQEVAPDEVYNRDAQTFVTSPW